MYRKAKRVVVFVGALGALGLGGSAIASATTATTAVTSTTAPTSTAGTAPSSRAGTLPGAPSSANFPAHGTAAHEEAEKAVTGATAEKVKAAAVKIVGSGTAGAVTTDYQGSGYETTVTKADGAKVEVHLDSALKEVGPGMGAMSGHPTGPPPAGPPPAGRGAPSGSAPSGGAPSGSAPSGSHSG